MWKHTYFLLILCLCSLTSETTDCEQSAKKVTGILIIERGFSENHKYVIRQDSILVDFMAYSGRGVTHTYYARFITPNEKEMLLMPFHKLYLSRLKSNYEGPSLLDHDWSYDFSIYKGDYLKEIRLFKYRLAPAIIFCKNLNRLLPSKFKISYTESYFEK